MSEKGINRRTLLRRSAAGAIGTVGVIGGANYLDHGPAQKAEAIAPAVVAGAAAAYTGAKLGVATGWALREYEVIGSNPPAEGETRDSILNGIYSTITARESQNASAFFDNKNIVENIRFPLYSDMKITAFEALNDQLPQDDIYDAAIETWNAEARTIKLNIIRSWNESIRELETMDQMYSDHPDTPDSDSEDRGGEFFAIEGGGYSGDTELILEFRDETYDIHGQEVDVKEIYAKKHRVNTCTAGDCNSEREATVDAQWSPLSPASSDSSSVSYPSHCMCSNWSISIEPAIEISYEAETGSRQATYLDSDDWAEVYEDVEDVFEQTKDEFAVWLDGVYDEVQAGTVEVEDLLTPRELSMMMSDDEDYPQAVADLIALNIPADLEREAEIYLEEVGATVYGSLAATTPPENGLNVGETYSPSVLDGSIYFTYDVSKGEGEWSGFDEGLDGGILTFPEQPFPEMEYVVHTDAGETAQFHTDDMEHFEPDEDEDEYDEWGEEYWQVDVREQLETRITTIDSINYYSDVEESQYETIVLEQEFTIKSFTDSEGEEHESADFSQREAHEDDNYITQEEWEEMQAENEALIEKYEESQAGGGGISFPEFGGGIGDGDGIVYGIIALLVVFIAGSVSTS